MIPEHLSQADMKTCEVVLYSRRPTGKGKDRVWPKCGKPAAYWWTPAHTGEHLAVCAECAPQLAGNFTDELTPIKNPPRQRRAEPKQQPKDNV